jgi:hypothetical protein
VASPRRKNSNHLLETREEWNDYLERSDSLGDRSANAAVAIVDAPSAIVKISPSN